MYLKERMFNAVRESEFSTKYSEYVNLVAQYPAGKNRAKNLIKAREAAWSQADELDRNSSEYAFLRALLILMLPSGRSSWDEEAPFPSFWTRLARHGGVPESALLQLE